MNGWEGTQGSSYVARLDASAAPGTGGEAWTIFKSADSLLGGFTVQAVTPDGLLWGTTPKGRLAFFDGESWTDGELWASYDPPASFSIDNISVLAVAPDGALWLTTDAAIARFDPVNGPDEAWTIYTHDDGLPKSYYRAMAFGPDGEIWFGATRFQPAQAEGNAQR